MNVIFCLGLCLLVAVCDAYSVVRGTFGAAEVTLTGVVAGDLPKFEKAGYVWIGPPGAQFMAIRQKVKALMNSNGDFAELVEAVGGVATVKLTK